MKHKNETQLFKGNPCKRGHDAMRYKSTGECVECVRVRMLEETPEQKYRRLAMCKAYLNNLPPDKKAIVVARKKESTDRLRASETEEQREARLFKQRESTKKYRDNETPEQREVRLASSRERTKRWNKRNPEHSLALSNAKKTHLRRQRPPWVDRSAIYAMYKNCPKGYHVDHIVPLHGKIVSGLHVPWNLQYLPAKENMRKSAKFEVQ